MTMAGTQPVSGQQRIVIGGRAANMLIDAVYLFPGVGRRIVAYASADQGIGLFMSAIDAEFRTKPNFDKSAGGEVYASFKPDLVILKSMMKAQLKPQLDALGIPQLYVTLETPEQYYEDLLALGRALGFDARAKELVDWFKDRETAVTSRTSRVSDAEKPRILILQRAASGDAVWQVPPASWIQTIMVERAGGLPVWKNANPGSGWATVSIEQIAAWNPDMIFIINYRDNASRTAGEFRRDPWLAALKAVRAQAVFGFPQDYYSWDQPDTRWILGLTWLAVKIHPERCADISLPNTIREFYRFLYGLDEARFKLSIVPKLAGDIGAGF
ncbi:MAG: ABC transporter substrate-binding protein [Rectinema sp.]|nr:ABC transporter substrate-binding protein [Rectinema sp.]